MNKVVVKNPTTHVLRKILIFLGLNSKGSTITTISNETMTSLLITKKGVIFLISVGLIKKQKKRNTVMYFLK